ncbi:cation:proton antiporter [Trujillonella endophytica]|uniref:NhaP-type Na+/H+ or K+/H+ antiporter n=1 Tax=Trujillonella endophytica TaxID=673521 RepID=A0A1H8VMW0_9ACTN|nr:cation:proton antiporter [Trujillella endophytica]SEP16719.1 NhaP-type Na+/H+ or K+/H+ antiporter [Trujillella endophytica]
MTLDPTGLAYAAAGVATLLAALLPRALSRAPLSMPMVFVGIGVLGFALIDGLPSPDPVRHGSVTVHLTEVVVLVSLMGAGLALDRPVGWRRWSTTWRLLAITMPLSVLAMALLGGWLLGLGAAAAMLLAAALAPTDPVLASEVQVAEPSEDVESEDEARFALTSEAGSNDGLAFPFVYAAIAVAASGLAPGGWLGEWLLVDVLWRIAAGVGTGIVVGFALRALFFSRPAERVGLAERAEGFIALAGIALAYGLAELVGGYGFVAVFAGACTVRAAERRHGRHQVLHAYVEQLERLLTVVVLVLVGGAVARGVLDDVGRREIVFAALLLLVVRPLTGWLAQLGGDTGRWERNAIAFFGVRGVGSLYYLAYGLEEADIPGAEQLWAVTVLVVLGSVVVHGITAGPAMLWLDRRRARRAERVHGTEEKAPVTPV